MELQVTEREGILRVDSRMIAAALEIEHSSILKNVDTYREKIEQSFGPLLLEVDSQYQQLTGNERRLCVHMTEEQAWFIASLSRNTEPVVNFKAMLVKAFSRARQMLATSGLIVMPDFSDPVAAARAWADSMEKQKLAEQEAKLLSEVVVDQAKTIITNQKKVDYVNEVLTAENSWTTTVVAQDLGMSAIKLNRLLRDLGVQYKRDNHWVLTAKYVDKGYIDTRTTTYPDSKGGTKTAILTVWTEFGRAFVLNKVKTYREQLVKTYEQSGNDTQQPNSVPDSLPDTRANHQLPDGNLRQE